MKKLLTIAVAAIAVFAFAPTSVEAGYKSKRIGTCKKTGKPIYSYYRPFRNSCGKTYYRWVPVYPTSYSSRSCSSRPSISFSFGFGGYRSSRGHGHSHSHGGGRR